RVCDIGLVRVGAGLRGLGWFDGALWAGEVEIIDGKPLRGSGTGTGTPSMHRVSAWPTPTTGCGVSAKWKAIPTRSRPFAGSWKR
ncbi:MAG: hypothetical protein ACLGQU_05185, partial [Acidobacteriota bacterium]